MKLNENTTTMVMEKIKLLTPLNKGKLANIESVNPTATGFYCVC